MTALFLLYETLADHCRSNRLGMACAVRVLAH
jgi:hypothetical protein